MTFTQLIQFMQQNKWNLEWKCESKRKVVYVTQKKQSDIKLMESFQEPSDWKCVSSEEELLFKSVHAAEFYKTSGNLFSKYAVK